MSHRLAGLALVACLILSGHSPAIAAETPSPEPSIETQYDMNVRAGKELQAADQALNTAYRRLMAVLQPTARDRLVHAEQAWIAFRDADADFVADQYRGGTAEGMLYDEALTADTVERTQELLMALKRANAPVRPDAASLKRQALEDRRLNAVYVQLAKLLDATGRSKLVKAELAWMAFRDAECDFAGGWRPGSKRPETSAWRLAELTASRAQGLEEILKAYRQ